MAMQRDDRSNANGPNQVSADGLDLFDGRRIWVLIVEPAVSGHASVSIGTAMKAIDALEQAGEQYGLLTPPEYLTRFVVAPATRHGEIAGASFHYGGPFGDI
jgi:hypothetical protein